MHLSVVTNTQALLSGPVNCMCSRSSSATTGGSIRVYGKLNTINSTFENNTVATSSAGASGGALAVYSTATVRLFNTTFQANRAM